MKAMILAAGKGTRVRPLTNVLPKPMIPLIRKPIMEAIIDHLHRHAFDEIYVNTSYLSHAIEHYFRDGDRFGVSIAYSYEGKLINGEFQDLPLGSAGGMRRIQDQTGFFDDTFAVLCGDALIDVDLTEVLRFHRESGAIATIVTKPVPQDQVSKYGVVVTDAAGRVQRFQEKPSIADAASNTINTGIYLFEPAVFDHIPSGTEYDIGSQLFPRLIAAGAKVCAISLPFEWVDIGCVHDFWTATRMILEGKVQGLKVPGREIAPGVFVGLGVTIAESAQIRGPVYLGSGTRVGPGVQQVQRCRWLWIVAHQIIPSRTGRQPPCSPLRHWRSSHRSSTRSPVSRPSPSGHCARTAWVPRARGSCCKASSTVSAVNQPAIRRPVGRQGLRPMNSGRCGRSSAAAMSSSVGDSSAGSSRSTTQATRSAW